MRIASATRLRSSRRLHPPRTRPGAGAPISSASSCVRVGAGHRSLASVSVLEPKMETIE